MASSIAPVSGGSSSRIRPRCATSKRSSIRPFVRGSLAAADEADAAGATAVIIEAIKLVEGGLAGECDEVWLVTCDSGGSASRLIGRGSSEADAAQRIAAQGDVAARITPIATRVIDTTGDSAATRHLVEAALDAALMRPEA